MTIAAIASRSGSNQNGVEPEADPDPAFGSVVTGSDVATGVLCEATTSVDFGSATSVDSAASTADACVVGVHANTVTASPMVVSNVGLTVGLIASGSVGPGVSVSQTCTSPASDSPVCKQGSTVGNVSTISVAVGVSDGRQSAACDSPCTGAHGSIVGV